MPDGLEAFRQRYRALGKRHIPQLDLEIWCTPWTSQDELEVLEQLGGDVRKLDTPDGYVAIIIRKASDRDGNPLFQSHQGPELKRVGEAVVLRALALRIQVAIEDPGEPTLAEG